MSRDFPSLESIRERVDAMTPRQIEASYVFLLQQLEDLRRVDVSYHDAGCDCCSGSYEVDEDPHGEYVQADSLRAAITALDEFSNFGNR